LDVLIIIGIVIAVVFTIIQIIKSIAKRAYLNWLSNPSTPLDVDGFVDNNKAPNYFKIWFLQKLSIGKRIPSESTVSLTSKESPHVKGLQVTERAQPRKDIDGDDGDDDNNDDDDDGDDDNNDVENNNKNKKNEQASSGGLLDNEREKPLVIGTIRMGFGHHRIAYAACSWAQESGKSTYFHDLLNIDSPEADLIKATDAAYSKMSRITSNMGGLVEKLWGSFTLSGDGDALRISGLTAVHLRPLFKDLPLDTPIIASHCYVALAAVSAGFTNVINLVIDNHAQWFVVVPGCLNLVQGPANYQNFLKMGVAPENLKLAGHWIPRDLVVNIPADCKRRIDRVSSGGGEYRPRRILIPVGGAGAQRKFICKFVESLAPLVKSQKVQLFLNAGDHVHMKSAFVDVLQRIGVKEYDTITSTEGVRAFRDKLLEGNNEPDTAVTLFSFEDYFPAVATTDILSRVADVLACKPSELAFYPVPKLMIRRVGDHEQYSALRAAELGEGTLEARELSDCTSYMNLFASEGSELLLSMNQSIIENNKRGVYDGCKNAIDAALERSGSGSIDNSATAAASKNHDSSLFSIEHSVEA